MFTTIIIGLIALFFTYLYDRKICNWGFWVSMSILTIFCAIRWNWGSDMPVYAQFFDLYGLENVKFYNVVNLDVRGDRSSEYGWAMLNLLCQPIGFFGMIILLSVLEGAIIYWFIKKYVPRGYCTFAVFIYVFNTTLMVLGCSMIRQWLAMCIILIAIHYATKNKFVPFVVLVLLASMFHSSALICIIMYILKKLKSIKLNSRNILFLSIVIILWVYVFGRLLESIAISIITSSFSMYETYLERETIATVGFASLLNILVCIICLYSLKTANDNVKTITWIYAGYMIVLPFTTLIPLLGRVLYYFDIIGIAVIPNGLKNTTQPILKYGMIVWLLFWYIFTFFTFFNSSVWKPSYMEYNTIFNAPYWR